MFVFLDIVNDYHIIDDSIFLICNFPFTMNLRGDYLCPTNIQGGWPPRVGVMQKAFSV
jgi:hypothetical protein